MPEPRSGKRPVGCIITGKLLDNIHLGTCMGQHINKIIYKDGKRVTDDR